MTITLDLERPKTFATSRGAARLLLAPVLVLICLLFASAPIWATGSVLSGVFDGSEPVVNPLLAGGCGETPLGYVEATFKVTKSGTYTFLDLLGAWGSVGGLDIWEFVYEDSFDSAAPTRNLLAFQENEYSYTLEAELAADTKYVLVAQQTCPFAEGTWAVAITGPGTAISDHVVALPSFTSGAVVKNGQRIARVGACYDLLGDPLLYHQSGPIRVSRNGTYYLSDASHPGGTCVNVYTSPIDPNRPSINLVGGAWGWGTIELKAGQDYYFVAQRDCYSGNCEFFYVLAPPAPFRINHGLADSWYNPETPGQGFFLDVFEQRNEVFLGWFTYLTDPPAGDEFGHLWMTAFGPFAGTAADLAIEWTGGGAFDAAQPQPYQYVQGNILLEFNDCSSGQITYSIPLDIGGPGPSGVIPIQRNVNDAVALCESLYSGPGMPGPL